MKKLAATSQIRKGARRLWHSATYPLFDLNWRLFGKVPAEIRKFPIFYWIYFSIFATITAVGMM